MMTYWLVAILQAKGVRVFRVFCSPNAEFPAVKVIGYRQNFFKVKKFQSIYGKRLKSSAKKYSTADIVPITTGAGAISAPVLYKKGKISSQLKETRGITKLSRAVYKGAPLPLVSAKLGVSSIA